MLDGCVAVFLALGSELFAEAVDAVVKIIFVDGLAFGGSYDDDFGDASRDAFFDDILHDWAVAERQHGLGMVLVIGK